MPRSSELRERAAQALVRAQEIERREAESEEPLSEQDQQAHAAALQEVESLTGQADQIDERARRTAETENRLRESQRRGSTPSGRQGRSLVNDEDEDGAPMPRSRRRRSEDDGPSLEGYDIMRAIRGHAQQLMGRGRFDGLEREWHEHLLERKSGGAQGILIPWNAPLPREMHRDVQRRDLTTSTGAGAIPNDLVPTFLDLLRSNMVLDALGVRTRTASGKFWFPKKTAGTTGYWVAEGVDLTESDITIGQVAFDPKTVGAHTVLSRKFLLQDEVGGEDVAIDDIAAQIGQTIQKAAFNGSGSSGQPLGILQNSGVPTVAIGTNGGPLTYAKVVELANKPDASNAPSTNRAFVFHPDSAGRMEATPLVSGQPVFLWNNAAPNPVSGRRALTTSDLPANLTKGSGTNLTAAIYGSWDQLMLVMFSGLDLIVNPFSEDKAGNVRVTMFQDVDLNVLYAEAFAKIVDITTSAWA